MSSQKRRPTKPQLLAFLLPQFHRIPENDEWWGEGFTDWTNVKKAKPQFHRHRQPRVPLGQNYYDLTNPQVQDWQAELAKSHGIDGFCYYHYWFNGRRLLEKPVELLLHRGAPDFPFCLAWANHTWTRTWDGGHNEVLMPQDYGAEEDWKAHFSCLNTAFRDPRYIRVDGAPLLLIYQTSNIAACSAMLDCWRRMAKKAGFSGLHIASMMTYFGTDPRRELFDAYVAFEPNYTQTHLPPSLKIREKFVNAVNRFAWELAGTARYAPRSLDYRAIWQQIGERPLPSGHYPGAFVDWDNSPRKNLGTSLVMRNVDPKVFQSGFLELYEKAVQSETRFIFINAWNEWAEGTYLEPDEEFGTSYLDAIKSVVDRHP